MDKLVGQALFLLAVGPNLVLLALGIFVGTLWLIAAMFSTKPPPRSADDPKPRRSLSLGIGAQLGISAAISLLLAALFVRGDNAFGQVMFIAAVGPSVVFLAYGIARGTMWLIGAALASMAVPAHRHAHPDDAFHHPDPIATSAYEQIFMLGAVGLVLVGLPVALGAIFHFVLPLVGEGWGH